MYVLTLNKLNKIKIAGSSLRHSFGSRPIDIFPVPASALDSEDIIVVFN